jgi:hypothetical protein
MSGTDEATEAIYGRLAECPLAFVSQWPKILTSKDRQPARDKEPVRI